MDKMFLCLQYTYPDVIGFFLLNNFELITAALFHDSTDTPYEMKNMIGQIYEYVTLATQNG